MKGFKRLVLAAVVLFLSGNAYAAIIFEDNFESDSSSWQCTSGELSKWDAGWGSCQSVSGFGPTWKMGPGRNSSNAVYSWKKNGMANGYWSDSFKQFGAPASDVFMRWYMKVPPASQYNKSIGQGFKIHRLINQPMGLPSQEVYINVHGSTFADGTLVFYYNGTSQAKDIMPVSAFNDGQWHCHEIHIKYNTGSASDGVMEYWLDGQLKATLTNAKICPSGNAALYMLRFGIGNTSDEPWMQTEWSAIAFDDLVISTTYVGPASGTVAGTTPGGTTPVVSQPSTSVTQLFKESFEDTSFASRGWYESTGGTLSSTEHVSGSAKSLQLRFRPGDTTPYGGNPRRIKFTPTDSIYVSYWVKYSSNWQGQPIPADHHEFYIMTDRDDSYSGLAWTHLTAYIEQNHGRPVLTIQDGANVNTSYVNQNIVSLTENRAVAGCNGDSDGYGNGDCYNNGNWYNGKDWTSSNVYFSDTAGTYYKNNWHHVEVLFKMNSVASGKAVKDGQVAYWYDGQQVFNHTNVVLRTGANPTMKFNQFVIAPFLGDGSRVDQSFWIDNLSAATGRTSGSGSTTARPSSPVRVNVRVL